MINLPKEPVPGAPLGASWGRDVVRALRALRIIPGTAISVESRLNGQRVSGKSVSVTQTGGSAAVVPGPWDLTFSGEEGAYVATFERCYIRRGSFTMNVGDAFTAKMEYSLPTASTTLFVGLQYNSSTGDAEIISGSSMYYVSETGTPYTNKELSKTPLYELAFGGGSWSIVTSYREVPVVGLWV